MILGILQARMSSTRLFGKVLKPILGRPMLELQIERIGRCKTLDRLIVATSVESGDKAIADLCERIGVGSFRGELDNVLSRLYHAAVPYGPDHVVRLTGDCPLADPSIIDRLVNLYIDQEWDYASNCHIPTLPDGLDAEVFSFESLKAARENAVLAHDLEHVTPYIRSHPEKFRIGCYKHHVDLSHLRWTVDESEDFEFVRIVYERLYPKNPAFSMEDVLLLLDEEPQLARINSHLMRNEGARRGLEYHESSAS